MEDRVCRANNSVINQGNSMAVLRSFRDLDVYQMAREQARAIFRTSRSFPKEERYSMTDQIRRSSRAVNAIVAEAWARRRYSAAFSNKINEALGEAMETQACLDHALDCEYITVEQHGELDRMWQRIGAMFNGMIDKADFFCTPAISPPRKK
jgi:four helix bundle protein